MANQQIHRGPDDEGFYVDGSFGLGLRRLSVIDIETGHQPIGALGVGPEVYQIHCLELRRRLDVNKILSVPPSNACTFCACIVPR